MRAVVASAYLGSDTGTCLALEETARFESIVQHAPAVKCRDCNTIIPQIGTESSAVWCQYAAAYLQGSSSQTVAEFRPHQIVPIQDRGIQSCSTRVCIDPICMPWKPMAHVATAF